VVPLPTLSVPHPRKVVGFCYTPQDGNSLLSSVAATLRYLDPANSKSASTSCVVYLPRDLVSCISESIVADRFH